MKTLPRLALFLFFVFASTSTEAQFLHPKITDKQITIHNAVILPAKVEITKESAKGSQMMVAESEQMSNSVFDAVVQSLQQKKIAVPKAPFDSKSDATDDTRKYTLADIQKRYDALLPKLINKSKDVKKGRFTLGDDVMLLNVDKSADALVFIRGQGRVFTKGKTAFSLLNPFSFDLPLVIITIGIVDAHSGEVLAFTKPVTVSKILKDPKALNKLITKSLKKLPEAP